MKKLIRKAFCIVAAAAVMLTGFSATAIPARAEASWPSGPAADSINSKSAILVDQNTGTVLFEKDADAKRYPASITKILTVLVALENMQSMDEEVTFSEDAVTKSYGSGIARDIGEKLTLEQCLYAVMLESANECAYAVAEQVGADMGGDYQTFIDKMNEKAKEIGCTGTHFTNPNGLPDDEHYTTARDMMLISQEAYKNETFRTLMSTVSYVIPKTNKHDEELTMYNHHQMICANRTLENLYDPAIGGKTGYTDEAGNTLVTFAEKDGQTLLCIVMKTDINSKYPETKKLFEYGFKQFQDVNVSENEANYTSEKLLEELEPMADEEYAKSWRMTACAIDPEAVVTLPEGASFEDCEAKLSFDGSGEEAKGVLTYSYAGHMIGTADVTITAEKKAAVSNKKSEKAKKRSLFNRIKEKTSSNSKIPTKFKVIIIIIIIAVIIFLLNVVRVRIQRRRRRRRYYRHSGRSRRGPRW